VNRHSLGRTVFKNAAYITAGSLALKVLNFLFRVYLVRSLGDETFGQYSIVLAFVALFQIFAEMGISQYAMREIARDRSTTQHLFWNLVVLRLLLAGFGIVVITVAALVSGYSSVMVLGVFLYTWTFVLSALEAPLETVLVANERFDYITILGVTVQVCFAVLGSLVLYLGYGLIALVAVGLLAMVPQLLLAVWFVKRHDLLQFRVQFHVRSWPRLVRAGLPFGLISLSLIIARSIDTVILSWYWPDYVIGWYNAAYGLAISLLFLFNGFNTAIVPSLSKTFVSDANRVDIWYYRSVKMIVLISLPIAVGGMLVAYPLIEFLFTDQYLPAAVAFQILIWDVPLLMFASFCGNMTTVVDEERTAARIYFVNALANVVLNIIVIPRYGMIGAAVVTVLTDLLATLQFHFVLSRKLNLPRMLPLLLRVVLAAGLMGVIVAFASQMPLFFQITLGIVAYALFALLFRLLDESDWALLHRLANRGKLLVTQATITR